MFVGVTGQIGAGKSTAADILRSFGAAVIDADYIGRKVVEDSPVLRRKLARVFGVDVIDDVGRLNRRKVAERAFASAESRRRLNELVHPILLKELGREMRRLARQYDMVVIDAALLLDWGLDSRMDYVIVIDAPQSRRLDRVRARGISSEDAHARQKAQLPFADYQARADIVITNDGTVKELHDKLHAVWQELREKERPEEGHDDTESH